MRMKVCQDKRKWTDRCIVLYFSKLSIKVQFLFDAQWTTTSTCSCAGSSSKFTAFCDHTRQLRFSGSRVWKKFDSIQQGWGTIGTNIRGTQSAPTPGRHYRHRDTNTKEALLPTREKITCDDIFYFTELFPFRHMQCKHNKHTLLISREMTACMDIKCITVSRDIASRTFPKTTCLLSSQSHLVQVRKNWHPFVFFPLFAWQYLNTHDAAKSNAPHDNNVTMTTTSRQRLSLVCSTGDSHHGQQAWGIVLQVKTLVVKFITIYTHAPGAISLDTGVNSVLFSQFYATRVYIDTLSNLDKITALNHKVFNNPMKRAIFVTKWVPPGPEDTVNHQTSDVITRTSLNTR